MEFLRRRLAETRIRKHVDRYNLLIKEDPQKFEEDVAVGFEFATQNLDLLTQDFNGECRKGITCALRQFKDEKSLPWDPYWLTLMAVKGLQIYVVGSPDRGEGNIPLDHPYNKALYTLEAYFAY